MERVLEDSAAKSVLWRPAFPIEWMHIVKGKIAPFVLLIPWHICNCLQSDFDQDLVVMMMESMTS